MGPDEGCKGYMSTETVRNYRKFMVDEALEPSLLPSATWDDLFETYQKTPGNFYRGFEKMGVLQYDVEQMQAADEAEGKPLDSDEAARSVLFEVIDELGNDTWWQRAMALVEEDCRRDVAAHPGNYACWLDAVYDEQETRGWHPYWEPNRWLSR